MGFVRVKINGQIHELSEQMQIQMEHPNAIDLIVDRLVLRPGIEQRLVDSLEVASRFGRQIIKVEIAAEKSSAPTQELVFTQRSACIRCELSLPEVTPRLFLSIARTGMSSVQGFASHPPMPRREGGGDEADDKPCKECGGTRLRKESLAVKWPVKASRI